MVQRQREREILIFLKKLNFFLILKLAKDLWNGVEIEGEDEMPIFILNIDIDN